ncbi:uncharacterized protein N7482_002496 [Penicillium canariense]|uniref:Uncharacterized protein n=1 Tax=Penicillium canariense TaxID=189055 RepID=A0A9W9IFH3_9EURO|nr:uncharacterized protein N7482_002496 [Penicillium canariense]KAJ5176619.1 hypothetical protein N7482_002496 [Penicillium canariense]
MPTGNDDIDPAWPPGTIRIEGERGILAEIVFCLELATLEEICELRVRLNAELGFSFALLNDSYAAGCGAVHRRCDFVPFALKFGRRPIYILSTAV